MFFILTLVCFSDLLGNFVTLGDEYNLECLNDYLATIVCSLNISTELPGSKTTYWLQFQAHEDQHKCTLKWEQQSLMCVLDLPPCCILNDMDSYNIILKSSCHSNNVSVILKSDYIPKENIRPVPPSNLSMLQNKGGVDFQWESGYDPDVNLIKYLSYQLNIRNKHQIFEVEIRDNNLYVEDSKFEPHTNYIVRVRSRPSQVHYKGVWSQWGRELCWRTGDIHKETEESSFHMTWFLLLLLLPLFLISFLLYNRWRKHEYIPSPAPYFRDWNVDTKICTLLSGKVRDIMQGEESLQIDILTESLDTPHQPIPLDYEMMGKTSESDSRPQSPSTPHSPVGSEVDSGCWIRDVMATERGSITCSEDYCTLSNSQHI